MADENLKSQSTQSGSQNIRVQAHSKDASPYAGPRPPTSSDETTVMDAAQDLLTQARDGAAAVATRASTAASDGLGTVKDYAKGGGEQITEQIRQRPTEALLIAGVVGLLLGMALAK